MWVLVESESQSFLRFRDQQEKIICQKHIIEQKEKALMIFLVLLYKIIYFRKIMSFFP